MKSAKAFLNKISAVIFGVSFLGLISLFFVFGTTLNTIKYKTDILVLSNGYKNNKTTHLSVTSEFNAFDSTELNKISSKIRQISPDVYLTYGIVDKGYLTYYAHSETINLFSMPTYSDKGLMEWGNIPLFGGVDYSIRKGPLFGARFPSYIPSSIASSLCDEFNIESFGELLDYGLVYSVTLNGFKYTFSINNIYYNKETNYWSISESDIENSYVKDFTRWNQNGIFTYGHSIYRENQGIEYILDYKCSYSVTDAVIKKILEMDVRGYNFSFYDGTDVNDIPTKKVFSAESLTNIWDSTLQIVCYITASILLMIMCFVFAFSGFFRQRMVKTMLFLSCVLIVIFLLSEILKSIMKNTFLIYLIFNSLGMALTLVFVLLLFTISIVVHEEKKHE